MINAWFLHTTQNWKQFKCYKLFISGIWYLMFSDCGWVWVSNKNWKVKPQRRGDYCHQEWQFCKWLVGRSYSLFRNKTHIFEIFVFSFSNPFWKESESQIKFAGSFSFSGHSSNLRACCLPGPPDPVLLLSVSSRADYSQCLSSDFQLPHVCSISIPHLTFYSPPPPIPKHLSLPLC